MTTSNSTPRATASDDIVTVDYKFKSTNPIDIVSVDYKLNSTNQIPSFFDRDIVIVVHELKPTSPCSC